MREPIFNDHNVEITGRRDSSFHFVSFGMTGSRKGNRGVRSGKAAPDTPINKGNCHFERSEKSFH